jgi:hypothetical protein
MPLRGPKLANMALNITIKGNVPSKKNSKIMVCRGRRPILLPSAKYKEWHKDASEQLPKPDNQEYHNIHCTFYAPNKRKFDLSNKFESVADLLVDNKIIEDDNWSILENVVMLFGGVCPQNPRVEIELS